MHIHFRPSWPLLLFPILAILTLLEAVDVSQKLEPQGPLKVTLDYALATSWPPDRVAATSRNYVYSSHLTFASSVDALSDSQLWTIAADGFREMDAARLQYSIKKGLVPRVMTVLAFGNEIILASSMKGASSFNYAFQNTPVLESLQLCQMVWRDCICPDCAPMTVAFPNFCRVSRFG